MDTKKKNMHKHYILFLDLFAIVLSFMLSTWIRFGNLDHYLMINGIYMWALVLVITLYTMLFFLYDYHIKFFQRGFVDEALMVLKSNLLLAILLIVIMFIFQQGDIYSRIFFLLLFIINIMISYTLRQYFKILYISRYQYSKECTRIMIITTSDQVMDVLDRKKEEESWDYQIAYLTIIDRNLIGKQIGGIEIKSDFSSMYEVAKNEVIDEVFIHLPNTWFDLELEEIIATFEKMGITVNLSINTFGLKINEKVIRNVNGYHVLTFSSRLFDETQMHLKRMIDIIGGLIGCILTVILTIVIAPAIWIESHGTIFFSQTRIGRNGRRFRIHKFRSMYPDAEKRLSELASKNEMNGFMFKMREDPRITKVGKILRKTSLDEFPQFFNVLKGDMSLVGTRPPTEREFLCYEGRHRRRLVLKAGVTGLWQVNGRSEITDFEDVVKMDLEYIDNWSLLLDAKILFKTIAVVIFGKGAK